MQKVLHIYLSVLVLPLGFLVPVELIFHYQHKSQANKQISDSCFAQHISIKITIFFFFFYWLYLKISLAGFLKKSTLSHIGIWITTNHIEVIDNAYLLEACLPLISIMISIMWFIFRTLHCFWILTSSRADYSLWATESILLDISNNFQYIVRTSCCVLFTFPKSMFKMFGWIKC